VPEGKLIRAIAGNLANHEHPGVRAWLAAHPRWMFSVTPTFASWLYAAEGCFGELTNRRLQPGVFRSIAELQDTVDLFFAANEADAGPFRFAKDRDKIRGAVK